MDFFRLNIATLLTFFRIFSIPLIYLLLTLKFHIGALILFVSAILSDFLDGYLARKYNDQTIFGSWLDPFADKLFILFSYGYFSLYTKQISYYFFYALLIKEIALIVISTLKALTKKNKTITSIKSSPSIWGKSAMGIHSMCTILLLLSYLFDITIPVKSLLTAGLTVSYIALFDYGYKLFKL